MDEKVVSAFPLPPNYFKGLMVEEIQTMQPPPSDAAPNLKTFGRDILKDGQLVDLPNLPLSIPECVERLRVLKTSLFKSYDEMLEGLIVNTPGESFQRDEWKRSLDEIVVILNRLNHMQILHHIKDEILMGLTNKDDGDDV